jgi:PhnB protein
MPLRTYLSFPGTCADALSTYAKVVGGTVEPFHFWENNGPAGFEDRVIHGEWRVDGAVIFACDTPPDRFEPARGTSLSWNTADFAEAERVFTQLSEGGEVVLPFGPAPWSAGYGMLVDRFGIPWQVNVDGPSDQP